MHWSVLCLVCQMCFGVAHVLFMKCEGWGINLSGCVALQSRKIGLVVQEVAVLFQRKMGKLLFLYDVRMSLKQYIMMR